jgi:hypothetical protein
MRVINVPMRVVLDLPVAAPLSGQLMPVGFTGRKTPARWQSESPPAESSM